MLDWIEGFFFEKAGGRIKKAALILFFVEVIVAAVGAVIAFFGLLFNIEYSGGMFLLTPIAFAVAVGAAWLVTLPLYGFGELLESNYNIEMNTRIQTAPTPSVTENDVTTSSAPVMYSNSRASLFAKEENGNWRCPECDTLNSKNRHTCQGCMKPRSMQSHKTVPMSNVIVCSSCGLKNNAGVKKCWNCGARL